MKWWIIPVVVLSVVSAPLAGDVRNTGNDFLAKCGAAKAGSCAAYVAAIHDAALFWSDSFGKPAPFCLLTMSTDDRAVDVVLKYLNEHPETLHNPAIAGIVPALGYGVSVSLTRW